MFCGKCGNELLEDEKFCGKCGSNIEEQKSNKKSNNKNKRRICIVVSLIILIIVCSLSIFLLLNNDNLKSNSLFKTELISNEELINILKNTDDGIGSYLQETTVKIGSNIDIEYYNYNKLISYSCTYINGSVTLNSGGLLLYNEKENTSKIISMNNDLSSIIYYFNTAGDNEKVEFAMREIMDYMSEYDENLSIDTSKEEYIEMGIRIGEKAGVELCRKIVKDGLEELRNIPDEFILLYKPNEIFFRYAGNHVTEQQYCWDFLISEDGLKTFKDYYYDAETYQLWVSLYGPPYKTVKKFAVYDMTKEDTPLLKKYSSLEKAKSDLGLEE